jgi:hypothetical protein
MDHKFTATVVAQNLPRATDCPRLRRLVAAGSVVARLDHIPAT